MASSEGWAKWPWPAEGTLKRGTKWWPTLHARGSIAQRVRFVEILGNIAIFSSLGFLVVRMLSHDRNGTYQTRNSRLTGQPPALVAQYYDFKGGNRTVSREKLAEYQESGCVDAFKY